MGNVGAQLTFYFQSVCHHNTLRPVWGFPSLSKLPEDTPRYELSSRKELLGRVMGKGNKVLISGNGSICLFSINAIVILDTTF